MKISEKQDNRSQEPFQKIRDHEALIEKIFEKQDLIRLQITRKRKTHEILASSAPLLLGAAFLAIGLILIFLKGDIFDTPDIRRMLGIAFVGIMIMLPWLAWHVYMSGGFGRFEQTFVDLTPEWIQVHFKCSVKISSWSILTANVQPSEVTIYSDEKTEKLGINREGSTLEIPCQLSKDQRENLIYEIREYLAKLENQRVSSPEQVSRFLKEIPGRLKTSKQSESSKTKIEKTPGHVCFHIHIKKKKNTDPNNIPVILLVTTLLLFFLFAISAVIKYLWSRVSPEILVFILVFLSFPTIRLALYAISLIFGKTKQALIDLTPDQLQVKYGSGQRIWNFPTDSLQSSPNIISSWNFKNDPALEINSAGIALHFSPVVSLRINMPEDEASGLIRDIHQHLSSLPPAIPAAISSAKPAGEKATKTFGKDGSKPYGSKITKNIGPDNLINFHIPHKMLIRNPQLIIVPVVVLIGFNASQIAEHPIFVASFALIGAALCFLVSNYQVFGKTLLELSPEWIRIHRKCFGLGKPQQIPANTLKKSDIKWHFEEILGLKSKRKEPKLEITYVEKPLEIGYGLTKDEIEWLIREINEYYSLD